MTATMTDVRVREAQPSELDRWDELVRRFPNHRVTHTRAWIDSLVASGCGRPLYLLFERGDEVVGCLPGLVVSVGPWRLFGSPRAGWQTVSMGPAFDPERMTTGELLEQVVPYLEQQHQIAHIEMMHTGLDPHAMQQWGFEGRPVFTYRVPLCPEDPLRTFKGLKDSARRNVHRAERLGLVVRFEDDEQFIGEHFEQIREVFQRNGHALPFSRQRLLVFFRELKASGNLVAVSVRLPAGVSIASGMFFIEGRELSLWMWAHRTRYRWYRPTELMTWTVMRHAMAQGCETFDLMGGGDFKTRLGAVPDHTKWRWLRSRPQWLMRARSAAETGYRWQQSLRGHARNLARRSVAALGSHDAGERETSACMIGDVDLVRALGLARIPTVVAASRGSAARFSRHASGALDWGGGPWDRSDHLIERLLVHGSAQPEPPALFYQDDRALLMVSRNRDRLRQAFRFVIADAELVEMLVDKARFQKLAERLKLPVPAGRCLDPADQPSPDAASFEYPLLLKPLIRRAEQWEPLSGGSKAIRVADQAALLDLWPRLVAARVSVMAQTLIPGAERRVESYHTYVDERGVTAGEFTGRKIRTDPAEFGDSTAVEISDAPDVAALGREIVRRIGLRGVAKLDFKRGPDGRLYLLEINPRFTLWHHLGAIAGVNIPALVFADLVGQPRPSVGPVRVGVRWCKAWRDWGVARASGMSFFSWLRWLYGCEAKSALAWDDPMALLGAVSWRVLVRPRQVSRPDSARSPLLAHGCGRGT